MSYELDGPEALPNGQTEKLVILLHGLGADGNDLFGLVPEIKDVLPPQTAYLSPNAPFRCDMSPFGYQWFSMQSREESFLFDGVKQAAPILSNFITSQAERFDIGLSDVALIGFSQGTMMSLYVAPRLEQAIAGVVGFSGAMIKPELLKDEVVSRPPIQLIHGNADPVVPFAAMAHAEQALRQNDFDVKTLTCSGIGHGIDPRGLNCAREFLSKIF